MEHFLVCKNPKCHFVLDRRINGESVDGAHLILKKCPACGGAWSDKCPSCSQPLAMRLTGGILRSACCLRKPDASARANPQRAWMEASDERFASINVSTPPFANR